MLDPVDVERQYEKTVTDDPRILVVGAGIAGVTAAQLLRRDGYHPVLIERSDKRSDRGYMLALMPMVDATLDHLGVHDAYRDASVALTRYAVRGHTGRRLREDPMAAIMDRFGEYRGIARGALLDVLAADGCGVAFNSTVGAVRESSDAVTVSITTAGNTSTREFDLVIVADGMHSMTRDLLNSRPSVEVVDTEWGGWVVWIPQDCDTDLVEELWGAGFFAGTYPVAGEVGTFVGGPRSATGDPASFAAQVRHKLKTVDPPLARALSAVANEQDPFYWSLTDCRASAWTTRRTVLLGDAAAGFLPTAGVGAGMAMESAWVLTRLLRDGDPSRLAETLRTYERIQRPRVEAAQDNSRQLAKLMFHRSRALALVRELALRVVSVDRILGPIQRLLQERPEPQNLARAVR